MLGTSAAVGGASDYTAQAQSYNDLQGLQQIKQLAQHDEGKAFTEIGKQFESLLVHAMVKGMRSANRVWSEDSLLSSQNVSFYQDMLDDQLSLSLVQSPGMGLAEQFARTMQTRFGNQEQAGTAQDKNTAARAFDPRALDPGDSAGSIPLQAASISQLPRLQRFALAPAAAVQPGTGTDSQIAASATSNVAEKGNNVLHRDNFVAQLAPQAERAAAQLGIPVQALLAQAALETGWGERMIQHGNGGNSFNLFGIKADASWHGERATVVTREYHDGRALQVRADFRAYDSYQQSFDDYVAFLRDNPRYRAVFESRHDVATFASALQRAGYATDPAYAEKIDAIARRMGDVASPAYMQFAALAANKASHVDTATVRQP